jgi:hypothetical protein
VAGATGNGSHVARTWHYYCTYTKSIPATIYFSGTFDVASTNGTTLENSPITIAKTYKQFLEQQYPDKSPLPASCFGSFPTLAAAQTDEQRRMQQLQIGKKWAVVATNWIFTAPASANNSANNGDSPSSTSSQSSANTAVSMASQNSSNTGSNSANQPSQDAQENSNVPAAGTTVEVRMMDMVDSNSDTPDKQYRGIVAKKVEAGDVTIVPGSMAMIALVNGPSGRVAQLKSLFINGQTVNVSSEAATMRSSLQSTASSAMNSVSSVFGGFGHHAHNTPTSTTQAVASGQRVYLPPSTQLQFVLGGSAHTSSAENSASGIHGAVTHTASASSAHPGSVVNASSTSSMPVSGNLNAKITETRLGPSKQAGMYVVSPDGGHLAAFDMHGSREVIVIDGVDGPEYDHAAHTYTVGAIDVAFNLDGKRSGYIAQDGDQLVEVIDGKQKTVIGASITNDGFSAPAINDSFDYTHYLGLPGPGHQVLISPSGAHYACIGQANKPILSNMYLDDVKGPNFTTIDTKQVAFVNEKLVYAAMSADQKWHMVVNNKSGPAYDVVQSLVVSSDNKHYAFAAAANGGRMVVVDGVPLATHPFGGNGIHNLIMASNGRVGYIVDENVAAQGIHQALYVNSEKIASPISPFATVDEYGQNISSIYIVFSPDGKKFAYAKPVAGGIAAVIDGAVGRAYDNIGIIDFSPDSKHAYFVGVRNLNFVVVDGKEMNGQNSIKNFVFSHDGSRFGYEGYNVQNGFHMIVDGKESPRFASVIEKSLSFSLDGKHYVYGACTNYLHCQLVEDANVTNVPSLSQFITRTFRPNYTFPPVFFSPDSNRLVYAYPKSDGTSQNVYFLNGQEVVHGTSFEFPSFSPSSQHFAVMGWNGKGYTAFIDGKGGATYEELPEANLNIAKFIDANTFRFLGVKDGSVYRVTLDMGSN